MGLVTVSGDDDGEITELWDHYNEATADLSWWHRFVQRLVG